MSKAGLWLLGLVCLGVVAIFVLRATAPLHVPKKPATALKAFHSVGGQVEFQLPIDWISEPEDDYLVYFRPSSPGALRLSVYIREIKAPIDPKELQAEFEKTWSALPSEISPHPRGGFLWSRPETTDTEKGVEIVLRQWVWVHQVEGAVFSSLFTYAVEKSRSQRPLVQADMAMIEREIRHAKVVYQAPSPTASKSTR